MEVRFYETVDDDTLPGAPDIPVDTTVAHKKIE